MEASPINIYTSLLYQHGAKKKMEKEQKYYYGNAISDYGLENGYIERMKKMAKIYMKDIKSLCNCIVGLSCQTIRTNEKGAFNKGHIYSCTIYPYGNCITFQFI